MTPRATLRRAADLLREDAHDLAQSCERATEPPQAWACEDCVKDSDGKCNARRAYEERLEIAARVELLKEQIG